MPRFDVISDIQGDLDDLDAALRYFGDLADALLVVGDLTPAGKIDEYEALFTRLRHVPNALYAIGNHDFYNGESNDVSIARFLQYTGMPALYSRHDVGGVPVLRLGTLDGSEQSGHCVILGAEQLAWLDRTLAAITGPVLVMSHHALPHTVSGTFDDPADQAPKLYLHDYAESDALLAILRKYPNVVFLSGHTHWNLRRPDWIHRGEFTAVNTGAVQREFGPDGNGGEQPLDGPFNQGLRIDVDGSRVRIQAVALHSGVVVNEAVLEGDSL